MQCCETVINMQCCETVRQKGSKKLLWIRNSMSFFLFDVDKGNFEISFGCSTFLNYETIFSSSKVSCAKSSTTLPRSVGSIGESPSSNASAHFVHPREAAQSKGVHIFAFLLQKQRESLDECCYDYILHHSFINKKN